MELAGVGVGHLGVDLEVNRNEDQAAVDAEGGMAGNARMRLKLNLIWLYSTRRPILYSLYDIILTCGVAKRI